MKYTKLNTPPVNDSRPNIFVSMIIRRRKGEEEISPQKQAFQPDKVGRLDWHFRK